MFKKIRIFLNRELVDCFPHLALQSIQKIINRAFIRIKKLEIYLTKNKNVF